MLSNFDSYGTCLEDHGYEQQRRGKYIIGFSNIDQPSRDLIISQRGKCISNNLVVPKFLLSKTTTTNLPTAELSSKKYTAVAFSKLIENSEYPLDIWTIDQDKNIVHVQNGAKKIFFWKKFQRDYLK